MTQGDDASGTTARTTSNQDRDVAAAETKMQVEKEAEEDENFLDRVADFFGIDGEEDSSTTVRASRPGQSRTTVRARAPSDSLQTCKCGDVTVNCTDHARYELQGEMLLEIGTGRVWRYDKSVDAFVELRRLSSPLDEIVKSDVLDDYLRQLRNALERDLHGIPKEQQATIRASLEAKYIKPLEEEARARDQQIKKLEKKRKE